jgi:sugar-specific transcriptional regulator TrmB
MTKEQALNILLANYQFSKDETEVITYLSKTKAPANKILSNTSVSTGRIYSVLRDLENSGLIVKQGFKPAMYSMEPFRTCVENFLDYKLRNVTKSQQEVLNAVSEIESQTSAEVIHGSKKDFDMDIIRMYASCKWLKLVNKESGIPWFLYAHLPEEDFLKVRSAMEKERVVGSSGQKFDLLQKRASYLEIYEKKKVEHVMHPETLKNFVKMLNHLFTQKSTLYLEEIDKKLKKNTNVQIFMTTSLNTPFSVYVTDKEVLMPIFTKKSQERMVKLSGRDFIEIYSDYFDNFKKNSSRLLSVRNI